MRCAFWHRCSSRSRTSDTAGVCVWRRIGNDTILGLRTDDSLGLVERIEVLHITIRGRLVIPKGWAERGVAPHELAAREAFEEAGVLGRAIEHRSAPILT